jgi:hypothetical protein
MPRDRFLNESQCFDELTLKSLGLLAERFAVPIPAVFERLIQVGRLHRNSLQLLLHFAPNRFTGADPKWRVAGRALPNVARFHDFPWENEGVEKYGITLPSPGQAVSNSNLEFSLAKRPWTFRAEVSTITPDWVLGRLVTKRRRGVNERTLFPI